MTHPLYFIEHRGLREHYFLETDRDSNSRKAVLELIRTGEAKPVKVLEVNEDEGTCRDITDELLREIQAEQFGPTDDDLIADRLAARWDHTRDLQKEMAAPMVALAERILMGGR